MEAYNLRVQDRMESPGISNEPWPAYPEQPKPMIDSRDEDARKMNGSSPMCCDPKTDPNWYNPLDLDGNSHGEVKGFESGWQDNHVEGSGHRTTAPFKTSKE